MITPKLTPPCVIVLNIIINAFEWSDGAMDLKKIDPQKCHKIKLSNVDFALLTEHLGKHRYKLLIYRNCLITNEEFDNPANSTAMVKYTGKLK